MSFNVELSSCSSPLLYLALPRGTRWSLTLTVSGQSPLDHEADRTLIDHLSSLRAQIYNSAEWSRAHSSSESLNIPSAEAPFSQYSPREWRATLDLTPTLSGRHTLILSDRDHLRLQSIRPLHLTLSVTCLSDCELKSTHYPIVLVHGYAGVDQYFGVLVTFIKC